MNILIQTLVMGVFATIAIDIWSYFSNRVLKFPRTNWAMVGRWLGHLPSGQIIHRPISSAAPINNELLLGWVFHYLIGIAYAAIYVAFVFIALQETPTLLSAWVFGLVTVLSPWFILQPSLGLGVAASKAPKPNLARAQNLIIHSIFGVGLYYGWIGASRLL